MTAPLKLFNIPAAYPFLESFAHGLLGAYGDEFQHLKILLPTRRACRNLRNAFLRINDGTPFILPNLIPVGDLDEDELKLHAIAAGHSAEIMAIKPAISPLRRRLLLAQLIQRIPDQNTRPEQAVALADSLARLIDTVHNEDLSFDALSNLVAAEFATHWQITLDFLEIIRVHWPKILESEGCIDPADRRNRLIKLLINIWQKDAPQSPIIAAGITGSLPSTAALLHIIAQLPRGEVILPGLDHYMDSESWAALEASHPQHVFKQLLSRMDGVSYKDVPDWPSLSFAPARPDAITARFDLLSETMRPAESCYKWARLRMRDDDARKAGLDASLTNMHLMQAKTEQEEAEKISLILRETLEHPRKTAIVVTPDRALARRIGAAMRRWDIQLDDSAGTPMHYTRIGSWLQSSALFLIENMRPLPFLNFLHHQLASCGCEDHYIADIASLFDRHILRGAAPATGYDGLYARIDKRLKEERINAEIADKCRGFLDHLQSLTAPLHTLCQDGKHDFIAWLNAHIETAENLAAQPDKDGAMRLWCGEDGEEIALFLSELKRQAYNLPKMDGESYLAILIQLMRGMSVRPLYGTHPRLQVLGQLEARMIHADVMILAGLNEGTWPSDPGHDPWMSRPMRSDFGLPSLEQAIGQAAHDFVQCFTGTDVYLTRAERKDGAPTVTSRWLLRLNAVLQALGREVEDLTFRPVEDWHSALMRHDDITTPISRPEPRPPVSARPTSLAVTSIGRWMRDPYSLYASHILRLQKLNPVEEDASALDQGNFIHKVLEEFTRQYPDTLPGDAADKILALAEEIKQDWPEVQNIPNFWWPRCARALTWFVEHEQNWRKAGNRPSAIESTGQIDWVGFTLRATADRIDSTAFGEKIIIDYKTGTPPSKQDMVAGWEPQLPLEALIVQKDGFSGVSGQVKDLQIWRVTGGTPAGNIHSHDDLMDAALSAAEDGLTQLIKAFESAETPYYSLPNPAGAPDENRQDYAHLARVAEWELGVAAPKAAQSVKGANDGQ